MEHVECRNSSEVLHLFSALPILLLLIGWFSAGPASAAARKAADSQSRSGAGPAPVIVHPKFGGQILGYDIDESGTEGLLSEYVDMPDGSVLSATEAFDQSTGQILKVVAKTQTQDDFVTEGIFGGIGLVLHQHQGKDRFRVMNPLDSNTFTGFWTPPIKPDYLLGAISAGQGSHRVAAYQTSFVDFNTYVFSSNIARNTFGPRISLAPIMNVDEFLLPRIALDRKNHRAVLADSLGCPEPVCKTDIALVDLVTGDITEFSADLGIGTVSGLAVDSATGIACTTTLVDQGVEFYDLATQTGFEVRIPNAGSELNAGLDVELDPLRHLFLVEQYSSTGNPNDPQARVYVYDEQGNLKKTISVLRLPVSPSLIALNPGQRIGFLPVIVEPQHEFLELQSFSY